MDRYKAVNNVFQKLELLRAYSNRVESSASVHLKCPILCSRIYMDSSNFLEKAFVQQVDQTFQHAYRDALLW